MESLGIPEVKAEIYAAFARGNLGKAIHLASSEDFQLMYTELLHMLCLLYTSLRMGAEDYMVKPFEIMELLVRVEKVLERSGKRCKEIRIGDVTIDLAGHKVYAGETIVGLKPMEYDLLLFLAQNKNVAFSRDQLLDRIWGSDFFGETRTVDVHIAQPVSYTHLSEYLHGCGL